jgi:hypothetical protein
MTALKLPETDMAKTPTTLTPAADPAPATDTAGSDLSPPASPLPGPPPGPGSWRWDETAGRYVPLTEKEA